MNKNEKIEEYLSQKTLDSLKDKYFDEYAKELQSFRGFPKEIQRRIYFEYWFLLKKLTNQKTTVGHVISERDSLGIKLVDLTIARLICHISSNGCLSVYSPSNSRGIFDTENVFDVDFNYFNKANPTYKIGKFTTGEIINTISKPDENKEIIEKIYALVIFLKDLLKTKQ